MDEDKITRAVPSPFRLAELLTARSQECLAAILLDLAEQNLGRPPGAIAAMFAALAAESIMLRQIELSTGDFAAARKSAECARKALVSAQEAAARAPRCAS